MTDIVERLRAGEPCGEISSEYACGVKTAESGCQCAMAADEIERLRAALVGMLRAVCGPDGFAAPILTSRMMYPWPALDAAEREARAALEERT